MICLSEWVQSQRLKVVASSQGLPWLFAALAVLVMLPALWAGYWEDDHLFLMRFRGLPNVPTVQNNVFDICVSGDGNPERNHARMDEGTLPWWTDEHWKIAFWRPLGGVLHFADWLLFGDRAWVMHAHNILLYGMAVFVVTLLYRRMVTPAWAAALAGLMYLLDAAHAVPVSWIATRNAPLSSIFVILVIYFHDRWRRDGWKPGIWWALVALVFGLLASEGAVAAGAYLAGYAFFVDTGSLYKRFARLLPYLAIVVVWRVAYNALGYGVAGTMLYTDPMTQPAEFVSNVLRYLPVLLACQLGASEPGISAFLPPPGDTIYLALAVAVTVFIAWMLWPMLKRDRVARFWALGMVLSALPICTTFPQERELMNPSLGAFALIALFVGWHVHKAASDKHSCTAAETETPRHRRTAKFLAIAWLVLHVPVSVVTAPVTAYTGGALAANIEKQLDDTAPRDEAFSTLVTAYLPGDLLCSAMPLVRAGNGERTPKYGRTLCAGVQSCDLERTDSRTLVIKPDDTFLRPPLCQVFRDPALNPFHEGQVVQLTGFEATVLSVTPDGRPKEVAFQFDVPLEDPSLRWVTFQGRGYAPFTPPAIGQKIRINAPTVKDFINELILGKCIFHCREIPPP